VPDVGQASLNSPSHVVAYDLQVQQYSTSEFRTGTMQLPGSHSQLRIK
jgi:hypothetical protein